MDQLKTLLQNNLIYSREDIKWYEMFHRFGAKDPYNALGNTREYTFFTRPDCHIFKPGEAGKGQLSAPFANDPFFVDMKNRYPYILHSLQRSSVSGNTMVDSSPFMNILSNGLNNTIDLQGLTATEMDNAVNVYGTSIPYRKDAWTGDEGVEFSLEFTDTKFAEIYMLSKAYEEYERKVMTGRVYPPNIFSAEDKHNEQPNFGRYIKFKELHDVFGIFRFIVDEDMESLVYWAYLPGAFIKSVPRDAFNDLGQGLKLTIDFRAFCVIDMDPMILGFFNECVRGKNSDWNKRNYKYIPVYDLDTHSINGSWGLFPEIGKVMLNDEAWYGSKGMQYKYKLRWYGL